MAEFTAAQVAKLEQAANEASVMRSFVTHEGYRLFVREIEAKIADKKHEWLNVKTTEEAEAIRLSSKAWGEILHFAKSLILRGDQAKLNLPTKQESEPQA